MDLHNTQIQLGVVFIQNSITVMMGGDQHKTES